MRWMQDSCPVLVGKRILATKILEALKDVMAKGKTLYLRDDGKQKGRTWHVKGFCYSLCSHQADHVKRPTAEMNRFYEWRREAFSE